MSELLRIIERPNKVIPLIERLIDSPITLTIIGTAIAAFAGTYAATRIARKQKLRDDNVRELRITNAAINIAFEFCNSALSV
jgi:hypothetical protein